MKIDLRLAGAIDPFNIGVCYFSKTTLARVLMGVADQTWRPQWGELKIQELPWGGKPRVCLRVKAHVTVLGRIKTKSAKSYWNVAGILPSCAGKGFADPGNGPGGLAGAGGPGLLLMERKHPTASLTRARSQESMRQLPWAENVGCCEQAAAYY